MSAAPGKLNSTPTAVTPAPSASRHLALLLRAAPIVPIPKDWRASAQRAMSVSADLGTDPGPVKEECDERPSQEVFRLPANSPAAIRRPEVDIKSSPGRRGRHGQRKKRRT